MKLRGYVIIAYLAFMIGAVCYFGYSIAHPYCS
jgi:hypothetical protein